MYEWFCSYVLCVTRYAFLNLNCQVQTGKITVTFFFSSVECTLESTFHKSDVKVQFFCQ